MNKKSINQSLQFQRIVKGLKALSFCFAEGCPTNFECTLVSCHLKLIWSLNFEIVLRIDLQMALFFIWISSASYLCTYQTKSKINQNQFMVWTTIEKVAPNSKFIGHSTEIIWQNKTKGTLKVVKSLSFHRYYESDKDFNVSLERKFCSKPQKPGLCKASILTFRTTLHNLYHCFKNFLKTLVHFTLIVESNNNILKIV